MLNKDSKPFFPSNPLTPTVKYYTQLMNKAANEKNIPLCEQHFKELLFKGEQPTTVTLNVLLKAFCLRLTSKFYKQKAFTLFGQMTNNLNGYTADEGTYNILIASLAKQKQFDQAFDLIKQQKFRFLSTNRSLSSLIKFLPLKTCEQLFQNFLNDQKTFSSGNTFDGVDLKEFNIDLVVVNTLLAKLPSAEAEQLVSYAKDGLNLEPDHKTYSIVLSKISTEDHADRIFQECLGEGITPDLILLTSLLNAYVSGTPPNIEKAEKLFDDMPTKYNVVPDLRVYNLLIKGYTRSVPPEYEKSSKLLSELFQKSENQAHNQHRIRRGKKPVENSFKPSVVTVSSVVNAYCSAGLAKEAETIARESLATLDLSPNSTLYNTLIKGYSRCRCQIREGKCSCLECTCCDPLEGLRLVKEMETWELKVDNVTVNTLVDALCSARMFYRGKKVIDQVVESKMIEVEVEMYNVFLKGLLRYCSRRREYGIEVGEEELKEDELIWKLVEEVKADIKKQGLSTDGTTDIVLNRISELLAKG
eukprot:snap_masked-scaffold_22-processed-gene-5.36-mRNA-1 protein AED:1.00 eAED:1.00 QI:0/-1/0/0/-1/1/1/0/529